MLALTGEFSTLQARLMRPDVACRSRSVSIHEQRQANEGLGESPRHHDQE
jgi:hypothetical protein